MQLCIVVQAKNAFMHDYRARRCADRFCGDPANASNAIYLTGCQRAMTRPTISSASISSSRD